MINPKKTIPKLAGAFVALTGAQACGDDVGTATRDQVDAVINSFCMKVANCDIGYTMQECTEFYTGLVNSLNATPECYGAIVSYASCLSGLSCEQLEADSTTACYDVYDVLYDRC
jgi:hypothetical protein